MKKIGIITLNGYKNYGNRLQNYATEEILRSLGFDAETIINTTQASKENYGFRDKVMNLAKRSAGYFYNKIRTKIKKDKKSDFTAKKREKLKKFSYKYLSETNYSISKNDIPQDLASRYDYFITGSDQVWNPNYKNNSSIEFLTFAPEEKRIAYAPSFGVVNIPDELKDKYRKWLSGFSYLSVRENAGAKIIKDLIGKEVEVLVDPTMVLPKDKWLSISRKADGRPEEKYILIYVLGQLSKENKRLIEEVANEENFKIISISNNKDYKTNIADPCEFIDYFNSASVIFTDSFHGTIFSILFEVPFVVQKRQDYSMSVFSRLDTLLEKFNLESRISQKLKNINAVLGADFSSKESILEKERNKTFRYLKKALKH